MDGHEYAVDYEPAESRSGMFGGNSNWRGPVWFPVNYLIIESLQRFHHYFGEDFQVEFPTGSGREMSLVGSRRGTLAPAVTSILRDASWAASGVRRHEPFPDAIHSFAITCSFTSISTETTALG